MTAAEQAVLGAVRPRSLSERVRLRLSGGWTAVQVFERLDPTTRAELAGPFEADVATRRGIDQTYRVLLAAAEAGTVRRTKVNYTMSLNTKGPRDMLVDVFR